MTLWSSVAHKQRRNVVVNDQYTHSYQVRDDRVYK